MAARFTWPPIDYAALAAAIAHCRQMIWTAKQSPACMADDTRQQRSPMVDHHSLTHMPMTSPGPAAPTQHVADETILARLQDSAALRGGGLT